MAEPTSLLDEKVLTSPTLCEQPVESAVTSPVTSNSPVDIESGEPAENREHPHGTPLPSCLTDLGPWLARWLSFRRTPTAAAIELQKQKERADAAVKATKTRSLDDSPKGYPQLACFLSSDGSFSLYRGFSYLHSRVLLQLQDELAALEKELDDVDNADRVEGRTKNLKARRYDEKNPRDEGSGYRSRKEILDDIHKKILEYDEVLMKSRDVMAMGRPSDRDYKSVRTWFWNNKPLADAKESDFIKKKEDVISLRHGREWSAFDGFVENALIRLNRCFKSDILRVSDPSFSRTSAINDITAPSVHSRAPRKDQ